MRSSPCLTQMNFRPNKHNETDMEVLALRQPRPCLGRGVSGVARINHPAVRISLPEMGQPKMSKLVG